MAGAAETASMVREGTSTAPSIACGSALHGLRIHGGNGGCPRGATAVAAAGSAPWLLRAGLAAAVLLLCPLTCRTPWRVSSRSTARLRPGRTSSTSATRGCLSSQRTPSSLSLLQMAPRAMADRDGLRSMPWRATSSSAGRIRTRSPWQSSWWRPAAVVPRTCSTHYLQYPAPQNAGQPGGQCRRHPWPGALRALLFRQRRLQRVDRVSALRRPPRVSTSLRLGLSLGVSPNPNRSASLLPRSVRAGFGAAAWRRGGRRAAAAGTADSSALGNLGAAASTDLLCPPIWPYSPHPCISLEAATCMQLLRNRSCCIKPPARLEAKHCNMKEKHCNMRKAMVLLLKLIVNMVMGRA
ncbi:uncharacterized protein LOC120661277 isoform X4 [Panicum virgatum]|uniref:uncharacterized protein LOC120661277 isoform X4 n=1 Tax=Panicum virgatum TaxID=38727 RepID=UPI0019D5D606|nr:uncharacterized protein LOC120661277 isoform X4 [Panicum virgatum]XP_039795983.1 uncharacterized protein LOC120661277 isoform X4 [Panicum virgatum]XP_039795984.1 uncharacterized protein LOC120661277 isoform X4 [Panicum virgatum]XP_039795986.1 uncharacterized protein LOC120661277 isoform X4 [Panicum virgatum]XP_039795987.1 uncharacterized protein LOC120661277 isoform X4 [Panicum virgatum]